MHFQNDLKDLSDRNKREIAYVNKQEEYSELLVNDLAE